MPLTPLEGTLGRKRASHLLRRACFGATPSEINRFANYTAQQAVAELFQDLLPDPPLPVDPMTGTEWITTGVTDANSEEFQLQQYFLSWWIGQMLGQGVDETQKLSYIFRERLIFFLHTHFTTKKSVVGNSRSLYFQNALFRYYAFDKEDRIIPADEENPEEFPEQVFPKNFKELTKKICVDNAMLRFLDGRLNVKGSPNENFARELLELYTIGRGLEGSVPEADSDGDYIYYTEQDVQEGARVLSGFDTDISFGNIDEDTNLPRGVIRGNGTIASQHDNDAKTFSFRFDDQQITADPDLLVSGQPGEESVLDEINQLVEMIYGREETARYIIRKVYRFFVYHEITPDNTLINDLVEVFETNNYKLQPTLDALFSSREFYEGDDGVEDNRFGSIIKSPLDLSLGFARSFDQEIPDYETDLNGFYEYNGNILGIAGQLGLDLYEPFEVAGYSAYHQYPLYNRSWINTTYLTNRYDFIRRRIGDGLSSAEGRVHLLDFVRENFEESLIKDAKAFIIEVATLFLPVSENIDFSDNSLGELTSERLNFFYQEFLFKEGLGDPGEEPWTDLWENNFNENIAAERLTFLFNAILQSPEYQLM